MNHWWLAVLGGILVGGRLTVLRGRVEGPVPESTRIHILSWCIRKSSGLVVGYQEVLGIWRGSSWAEELLAKFPSIYGLALVGEGRVLKECFWKNLHI